MMEILIVAALLMLGFGMWYVYYGLECFMNGGMGRGLVDMHLRLLWEELLWVLPGGRKRRDEYMMKMHGEPDGDALPGLPHFLFTHVAIPFGPVFTYLIWMSK